MKTYKHLYPRIYDFGNLYAAYRQARKGKRSRPDIAAFEFDMEHNLLQLQAELRDQTYRPGPYHNFYIHEPKLRLVSAAPFRDRVVHHALCRVIEPIWEVRFISTSFACRRGKGTHKALDQCQAWMRRYRYGFHGDIVKYFPSIDHQIMRRLLARRIADRQVMWLIDLRPLPLLCEPLRKTGFHPRSSAVPNPRQAARFIRRRAGIPIPARNPAPALQAGRPPGRHTGLSLRGGVI